MSDFDKSAYWKLKTGKSEHKRAQELQRKREELREERDQVTA